MSQQAQQQQSKNPQPEWKPTHRTIFLVQTDAAFEPRARRYVTTKYGPGIRDQQTGELKHPWRVVTDMNGGRLTHENTIVVLWFDGDRPIREKDGTWRERDMGQKEKGQRVRKPEPPEVLESKPIACKDFWRDNGENDEGVDLAQLCNAITKQIHPCRAQLTDRAPAAKSKDGQFMISVRAV